MFTKAVGDIARARGGMMQLARNTGINREGLYKALSEQGNPVVKVMHALGLQFDVGARTIQGCGRLLKGLQCKRKKKWQL